MNNLEIIENMNLRSLLDSSISLIAAFVLGALIGLERQYRQRTAGLRTNVLVAVGAATFVDAANRLDGHEGAVHVLAYVVSGIGFLGAGAIMRGEANVQGLNTAATLWGSAAVGACAGADLLLEAILGTGFVLAANTLLRPVVNRINRQPLNVEAAELGHTVYVITRRDLQKQAMELLQETLASANLPVSAMNAHPFGQSDMEIEVLLTARSVSSEEMDRFVRELSKSHLVLQAFWSSSALQ